MDKHERHNRDTTPSITLHGFFRERLPPSVAELLANSSSKFGVKIELGESDAEGDVVVNYHYATRDVYEQFRAATLRDSVKTALKSAEGQADTKRGKRAFDWAVAVVRGEEHRVNPQRILTGADQKRFERIERKLKFTPSFSLPWVKGR